MIGKLIKHEALRTSGLIATIFGGALLLGLAGSAMLALDWPVFKTLGAALAISMPVLLLPATQLGFGIDYWRSSYRAQGYFTQTLPVKGSTIYWAKLLWAGIVSLAALVLSLALAVVAFWANSRGPLSAILQGFWDFIAPALQVIPWWGWPLGVAFGLMLLVFGLTEYFFAASIGSERRFNSMGAGGPVIVWFLLYIALQAVMTLFLLAIPYALMVRDGGLILTQVNMFQDIVDNGDADYLPVGVFVGMLVCGGLLIWRTVVSWNKKVSLA